jgi:putative membrane protein
MNFDLIRALHIIAVIAWVAGLLMLPRLYAYQTESQPGGELERKMLDGFASSF